MSRALSQSHLHLPGVRRGKVRDVYPLRPGDDRLAPADSSELLIVATDRLSAFDVVLPTPIPDKGRLLTSISLFWLRFIERRGLCATHLISEEVSRLSDSIFVDPAHPPRTTREDLVGRSMIVRAAKVIPIECVVRGYLEGSGLKEYKATGGVCGVPLPPGLRQCSKLPEPIFTPATKEEQGKHDENITFERACELVGRSVMESLRDTSLAIYQAASEHALARGIILADTKFEFGFPVNARGQVISSVPMLIDEALTPDSSRFWPSSEYAPGRAQASYDKQFVREYLETLVARGVWDKTAPGPELPHEVVEKTLDRYRAAVTALTR